MKSNGRSTLSPKSVEYNAYFRVCQVTDRFQPGPVIDSMDTTVSYWPEAVVRPIEALGQLSRHQTLRSGLTQSRKLAVPTPEKSGGPENTGRRDTVSAPRPQTAVRSP